MKVGFQLEKLVSLKYLTTIMSETGVSWLERNMNFWTFRIYICCFWTEMVHGKENLQSSVINSHKSTSAFIQTCLFWGEMHPGNCRKDESPKVSAQVQYPVRITRMSTNSNTTNKKWSTPFTEPDLRPAVQRNISSNQKLTVVAIVTIGVRFYHAC